MLSYAQGQLYLYITHPVSYGLLVPEAECRVFSFFKASRPALGSAQSSILWVPGFFSWGKCLGRDVGHSSQIIANVKNEWSYTSAPPICLHDVDTDITFVNFGNLGNYWPVHTASDP